MTLKSDYDSLDGELKHLICSSDEELAQLEQAAHPANINLDLSKSGPTLSPAESARQLDRIESNALIEELLGISSPSVLQVDSTPLAVDGQPLRFYGKAKSMDELQDSFERLIKAVIKGVAEGDPEALQIAGRNRTTEPSSLIQRMAEHADDFLDDGSPMIPFIKAYAVGDRMGMRRAVRPLALEMVVAEVAELAAEA
jgi:hypothetical protein